MCVAKSAAVSGCSPFLSGRVLAACGEWNVCVCVCMCVCCVGVCVCSCSCACVCVFCACMFPDQFWITVDRTMTVDKLMIHLE